MGRSCAQYEIGEAPLQFVGQPDREVTRIVIDGEIFANAAEFSSWA